jgi:hypothetical protein
MGRLKRTLFTLDWLEDPGLRRQTSRELNKTSRATAWRAPSSSIGSGKFATAPTKISSIAPPAWISIVSTEQDV